MEIPYDTGHLFRETCRSSAEMVAEALQAQRDSTRQCLQVQAEPTVSTQSLVLTVAAINPQMTCASEGESDNLEQTVLLSLMAGVDILPEALAHLAKV